MITPQGNLNVVKQKLFIVLKIHFISQAASSYLSLRGWAWTKCFPLSAGDDKIVAPCWQCTFMPVWQCHAWEHQSVTETRYLKWTGVCWHTLGHDTVGCDARSSDMFYFVPVFLVKGWSRKQLVILKAWNALLPMNTFFIVQHHCV